MNTTLKLFLFSAFVNFSIFAQELPPAEPSSEEQQYLQELQAVWDSLELQTGQINIHQASAILDVPEKFHFLNAKDAEKVLVDMWGNPPGQNVLGMLMPAEYTALDADSWAVTLEYVEDGYVSDEDAKDIDYSELLTQMKEDTQLASAERLKQGYEAIELIGWAAQPYYDAQSNKLHWAKEIKFGDNETNTLNYNIRVLGRKGVLLLNFIASIDQLPQINQNLDTVIALADFERGAKYEDFDPNVDKVAAYGVGALVAGKVLTKTGFLAALIFFFKKFGVFIVIGLGALIKKFFFGAKPEKSEA